MSNIRTFITGLAGLLLALISTPLYNSPSSLSAQTAGGTTTVIMRSYVGRISEPAGPSCMQSSLQLLDCDNRPIANLQTTANSPDLRRYLDQYVQIIGNEL